MTYFLLDVSNREIILIHDNEEACQELKDELVKGFKYLEANLVVAEASNE